MYVVVYHIIYFFLITFVCIEWKISIIKTVHLKSALRVGADPDFYIHFMIC